MLSQDCRNSPSQLCHPQGMSLFIALSQPVSDDLCSSSTPNDSPTSLRTSKNFIPEVSPIQTTRLSSSTAIPSSPTILPSPLSFTLRPTRNSSLYRLDPLPSTLQLSSRNHLSTSRLRSECADKQVTLSMLSGSLSGTGNIRSTFVSKLRIEVTSTTLFDTFVLSAPKSQRTTW